MCHPVHVAGALIIEEPGLHVDMYYRVIPSQIIMLYATMSSDLAEYSSVYAYTVCGIITVHFYPLLSSLPTPLPFHLSPCFQHCTVYVHVSVVMYSYIHLQVLVFKVLTYSIIYSVSVFVCTCMVSMCCVWCPCVVTAVLSSLFLFWSYFTRVVFHCS